MKRVVALFLLLAMNMCLFACDNYHHTDQPQQATTENKPIQTEPKEVPAYLGTWVPTTNEYDTPILWLGENGEGTIIFYSEGYYGEVEWEPTKITYQHFDNDCILLNYIEYDDQESFTYRINGNRMILTFEGMSESYSLMRIKTNPIDDNSIIGSWEYWTAPYGGWLTWSGELFDKLDVTYLTFSNEGTYFAGDLKDTYMLSNDDTTLELWYRGNPLTPREIVYPCPGIMLLYHPKNRDCPTLYYRYYD